ncbi:SH2 domain-containing protein 1A-like [Leucoraja erinacea]|uniref:SH2 domain-containing protein 1A-like n=1 Tax=Leucoraja erinaceus TaxID=7782 RepID=UPI0024569608|nr:SH2 domain-containing protein 1A-like [Leucoraja erinacea]
MSAAASLSYFHGNISKKDCEVLFGADGRDGSYLVRQSETIPDALCLSVLMSKYKYISFSEIDYAVKMNNCSFLNVCISTFFVQARHGVKVKSFKCLPDLIDHFKKPDKGLAIRLRYPVERSKAMNEDNENTYESMIKCYVLFLIIPISSI